MSICNVTENYKNKKILFLSDRRYLLEKPDVLFRHFKNRGWSVSEHCKGVYYVDVANWFPVQIVVTNEPDWVIHGWLKALSPNLKKDDFRKWLDKRNHTTDKSDRELIDSILEVSFGASKKDCYGVVL